MHAPDPHIVSHGQAALQGLDNLKADGSRETKRRLDAAMERLVVMRDELIAASRAGRPSDEWLSRTNAILSAMFGTEFPKDGLHWKRVCESREALRRLLNERLAPDARG